ncbi:HupE/UreJ family protein [Sandaracinobacteroides saxicola]|uniref:HupE/UreJ family protein n=1 Tax=Sandaracinobacteroides saxicola TaxID=2759707 RepID=A0A7G5II39_9SPHN|nr:HupE/UreJ family protein [Sandaracinobacteroides saxicola]QMW23031.1 HupE/UreJ family protein [Sandaracinobacteroides saxicola]
MRWLWLLLILLAAPAGAHTRSESFSVWQGEGRTLHGVFRVDARRATQLIEPGGGLEPALLAHLAATVVLTQHGAPCPAAPPRLLAGAPGEVRVELRFTCASPLDGGTVLRVAAFRDVSPSHVHYAVFSDAAGGRQEVVLSAARMTTPVVAERRGTDFPAYLWLGLTHVLSGADHLAFLLALALLAGTPARAALAATGFTLGHSLTLGLTATRHLSPDVPAIEAMIGFTVAWAAWAAMRHGRTRGIGRDSALLLAGAVLVPAVLAWVLGRSPAWGVHAGLALFAGAMAFRQQNEGSWMAVVLAAAFGLVHGAGFAGALIELQVSRDRILPALLGFNLGVEAAQLLVLAVVGLVALLARRVGPDLRQRARTVTLAALAMLGSFWFVTRSLG